MSVARVVDERAQRPLRSVIGQLLEESSCVDLAIARVRLATLDLTQAEVEGPARCRVLLGQLDASTLHDAATVPAARGPAFRRLAEWLVSERLEVRSAGLGAWTPDFSVFSGPDRATCLLGAHYFGSPQLTVGPSVTLIMTDEDVAQLLRERFQELWDGGHDVAPAIVAVLQRAIRPRDDGSPSNG